MGAETQPGGLILGRIRESLRGAQEQVNQLRRRNARYVYTSVVTGALGAVVAGLAAALGPAIGTGPHAWKLTCGVVALLSACATVASGLGQQFSVPDRLAKASACAGRLHALEIELTLGERNPAHVAKEYEELVAVYGEFTT